MNQVQKLEALLSRVQDRRTQPHASPAVQAPVAAAPAPRPAPAAAPAPRAPSAPVAMPMRSSPTERAAVVEERVNLHGSRAAAPVAAAPVHAEARLPDLEPVAPMPQRSANSRTSTPLEMALEDEFNRQPMAAAPRRHSEPSMQTAPAAHRAEISEQPFTIEPEPLQEPARPIAQVMSKHSVEMDITFGAMLKRSLSLRPR